jgi:hypothetical protein
VKSSFPYERRQNWRGDGGGDGSASARRCAIAATSSAARDEQQKLEQQSEREQQKLALAPCCRRWPAERSRRPPALHVSSFAEQLQIDQDEVFASRLDNDRGAMDIVNGLNDAVQLLQEQEDQGVAADRTQDLFMTAVMHDSKLYDAVLAYFTSQKDANPNTEAYTSLVYVCVKLRQLDEGFKHFERR